MDSTSKNSLHEVLAVAAVLIPLKLKSVEDDCLASLAAAFEQCAHTSNYTLLSIAADALEAYGHTDKERDVVHLCFSLLSVMPLTDSDFKSIRGFQKVLDNAMRYAHPSVNNDQCSVFAQLFIKVFKAVEKFLTRQCGVAEEVDELVHGLNSLAHALTFHEIYYSRVRLESYPSVMIEQTLLAQ
ncbi:unnamed protein product [Strongylus vulgaris]|uniref:Uncharacterized protein n=1 Tax=Strongylus vulgaris TaxID=40348 RepID=A0A3P7K8R4_STRVU|nr:unnamed protein product [Strongylus vulgaris]